MGRVEQDVYAHIAGVLVFRPFENLLVVQSCGPPGERRVEGAGVGLHLRALHVQKDRVHDLRAEPGNLKAVSRQVFLILGAVVGNHFRLALPLVHFKGAVHPAQLDDLAPRVEKMGEFMVAGAKLLFQPEDLFERIDRPAEFRLQEIAQLGLVHLCAERVFAVPAGHVAVIQALFMEEERATLQKAVDRHPPEPGQPESEPDPSVAVQPVTLIEEALGGVHDLVRRHAGVELQLRFRGFGADPLEQGALGELRLKQDRLERAPENALVERGVPVAVEHGEQPLQLLVFIAAPRGAEDDVPVEIHPAAAVVGLEVGREGVVPGTVPYDVVGSSFLELCNALIHSSKGAQKLRR